MVHPIWKNYIVNLGEAQSAEYIISYSSAGALTPIYSGKAWRRPSETAINIRINDICADWLTNSFPSLAEDFDRAEMPVEFVIQRITDAGQYQEVDRVRFINDWSYNLQHDAERDGLAAPINGHIDARQWLLWTALDVDEAEAVITLADGSTIKTIIPVALSVDFDMDMNEDFATMLKVAASGTAVFSPSLWENAVKVSIGGHDYPVVGCNRYVLYYLNAFGGWDSFLIEGNHKELDSLTRLVMNRSGEYERQQDNYLNQIKKRIAFATSWLTDEESLRMHHLLNSTDVFLHDLEQNVILPVILEGTETEYKTYRNNACQLVNYAFEVTIAQTRMRR